MSAQRPHDPTPAPTPDHGQHTLRVWRGTVVGLHKGDVFVELGPRMQGVLSERQFDPAPRPGEEYDFTVLGQDDGLWALARIEQGTLDSWNRMEVTSWVQARVTGLNPGGFELKVGPLYAFMPRSESGLDKGQDPKVLVGTILTAEVIEIDTERQRVLVSRKAVLKKERLSQKERQVSSLKPGQTVHGRVSRIEPYGAFVRFGSGLEGLIHVGDLSVERIEHPDEVVKKGQHVEVKVLTIRQGGKRIGLGLKQMRESPWKALMRTHYVDQVVEGRVTRREEYGVFVSIVEGVEGLLHNAQSGFERGRRLRDVLRRDDTVVVRIDELDFEGERMSLSLLHRDGSRIHPEEALRPDELVELADADDDHATTNLGKLIARALRPGPDDRS